MPNHIKTGVLPASMADSGEASSTTLPAADSSETGSSSTVLPKADLLPPVMEARRVSDGEFGAAPTGTIGEGAEGRPAVQAIRPADKRRAALLEAGSYSELAARSVRDGMSPDHIPSHAARRAALERRLGRDLTPAEDRALRNAGTCLMVPSCMHVEASRTYGGVPLPISWTRLRA
jgi:hypothetical protein